MGIIRQVRGVEVTTPPGREPPEPDTLLLVLPVPLRCRPSGELLFERQACNGLDRWSDHFGRVIAACPLQSEESARRALGTAEYLDVNSIPARDRIEFVPLPWAYALGTFALTYRRTRAELGALINRSRYLSFAIGGLVGDWASVAALEAHARGRSYSVWTDRVEHRVILATGGRGVRGVYRRAKNAVIISPLMMRCERHVISRCDLGLFHGRDCYDAYAPYCRAPELVHDIHLKPEDAISPTELAAKVGRARQGGPLRLLYVGRADEMKGPLDWIAALARLRDRGVGFAARWLGDGPRLPEMYARVAGLGLAGAVELPGFVGRGEVMGAMREADLFVFCHKTPESPRCLIESLVSGTPIVGYDSPYPRDLLRGEADELLVPRGDVAGLADRLGEFARRPDRLVERISSAAKLGEDYSDVAVFRHRSELIKRTRQRGSTHGK